MQPLSSPEYQPIIFICQNYYVPNKWMNIFSPLTLLYTMIIQPMLLGKRYKYISIIIIIFIWYSVQCLNFIIPWSPSATAVLCSRRFADHNKYASRNLAVTSLPIRRSA